jgi:hypothetical protein
MDSDGVAATDLEPGAEPELDPTARRGCLVAGCGCTDVRIVSPRRARFHAYLAAARGETADRVIAPDPAWRPPASAYRGDPT